MTKPIPQLGLIILLATAPMGWAQTQTSAEQAAVNEAVYRQANKVILIQKLAEARAAQARHDLPAAAKLYDECWDLVQKTGTGVEAEREQTISGLTTVRLAVGPRGAEPRPIGGGRRSGAGCVAGGPVECGSD